MTNFFLADEINRASPKTQSALLEVMQEGRMSVDGKTYEVPKPFIVMATQNPFGSAGTQPLPESQTDRFMIRITVGYPTKENEIRILEHSGEERAASLHPIVNPASLIALQKETAAIHEERSLLDYMVSIAEATRNHPDVQFGISPRGTMALSSMVKAHAMIAGRSYAVPEDVTAVAPYVLAHRIHLTSDAYYEKKTSLSVLNDILKSVPLPPLTEA